MGRSSGVGRGLREGAGGKIRGGARRLRAGQGLGESGGSGVAGDLCGAGGGWELRPRVARSRADRLSKAPVAAGAGALGLPEPASPTPGEGGGGGGVGRGQRGCGGGGWRAAVCPGAVRAWHFPKR